MAAGEVPVKKEYEDDTVFAIHDIHPKAPLHVLIIPRAHKMDSMNDTAPKHKELLFHLMEVARDVAKKYRCDEYGYKLLFNVGTGGGQSIPHLHLHLLGKKQETDKLTSLTD